MGSIPFLQIYPAFQKPGFFKKPGFYIGTGFLQKWDAPEKMLIGYARASTEDPNLNLQRNGLEQAGCSRIYVDPLGGAKAVRPGLEKVLEVAKEGDVLVVWRLDWLGRSLKDLIEIMETLYNRGIELLCWQEALATTSCCGKLIFHLFETLAEFERTPIRERTQAGLKAARARGRKGGRLKALEPEKRQLAVKLYDSRQHTISEICRMMGISKPTLYSYIAKVKVPQSDASRFPQRH